MTIRQIGRGADPEAGQPLVINPDNIAEAIPKNRRREPMFHREEVLGRTPEGRVRHLMVDELGRIVLTDGDVLGRTVLGEMLETLRAMQLDIAALKRAAGIATEAFDIGDIDDL